MNNTNPQIEPRLSEYLRKKKYFEENNITPSISLEKQYFISSYDLKKIKKFMINNTNPNPNPNESSDEESDPNYIEFQNCVFPSTQIKDKRLDRITQKNKRDKDAMLLKNNINELEKTYDMFSRNVSSTTSCDFTGDFTLNNTINENNNLNNNLNNDLNNDVIAFFERDNNSNYTSFNNTNNSMINNMNNNMINNMINPHELRQNTSNNQYNVNSRNEYNKQYSQYTQYNQNKNAQNSLGMGYKKHEYNNSLQQRGHFDIDNKVNIPSSSISRKSVVENTYDDNSSFGVPLRNIDYENYIKYGNLSSKAKSIGFDSVCNNNFQFIDSDIQNPLHVVNDRPISARLDNTKMARSTNRTIYQ